MIIRRALALFTSALVALAAMSATPVAAAQRPASAPRILLVLGDSLAAGYQPTDGRELPPLDPSTGIRDLGYPAGYGQLLAKSLGLRLTDLGCPGETTSSITGRPAQPSCAGLYRSAFGANSQLGAAETFLDRHRNEVPEVTIDIGANDLDQCASASALSASCLLGAESKVASGLSGILGQLTSALRRDDPGARLETMNYYDPFLARAFQPGGVSGFEQAAATLAAAQAFNGRLASVARAKGVAVADVAGEFHLASLLPVLTYAKRQLPSDVAAVCKMTWMCPVAGSSRSPDIHPNDLGYRAIAAAFEHAR